MRRANTTGDLRPTEPLVAAEPGTLECMSFWDGHYCTRPEDHEPGWHRDHVDDVSWTDLLEAPARVATCANPTCPGLMIHAAKTGRLARYCTDNCRKVAWEQRQREKGE